MFRPVAAIGNKSYALVALASFDNRMKENFFEFAELEQRSRKSHLFQSLFGVKVVKGIYRTRSLITKDMKMRSWEFKILYTSRVSPTEHKKIEFN